MEPSANYWLISGSAAYQIPRPWFSDAECRRYYHDDLRDVARLDEVWLCVELGRVERALGVIDRRRELDIAWLRGRRKRLIAAIQGVRRRRAA